MKLEEILAKLKYVVFKKKSTIAKNRLKLDKDEREREISKHKGLQIARQTWREVTPLQCW